MNSVINFLEIENKEIKQKLGNNITWKEFKNLCCKLGKENSRVLTSLTLWNDCKNNINDKEPNDGDKMEDLFKNYFKENGVTFRVRYGEAKVDKKQIEEMAYKKFEDYRVKFEKEQMGKKPGNMEQTEQVVFKFIQQDLENKKNIENLKREKNELEIKIVDLELKIRDLEGK